MLEGVLSLDGRIAAPRPMSSGLPAIPWHRPMSGRDPDEAHRAATPLELFFDLASSWPSRGPRPSSPRDRRRPVADAVIGFSLVFFAIWWAWMNFTWFASATTPTTSPYRLLTLVQMAGVLVLAAGVPRGVPDLDLDVEPSAT